MFFVGLITLQSVSAEGKPLIFVDVFRGYQWGQSKDIERPGERNDKDLEVHNGPAFGGRIGSWLKTNPNIGIAIDATHFDSDIDNQQAQFIYVPDPLNRSWVGAIQDLRVSNTLASIDLIIRRRGERFTP